MKVGNRLFAQNGDMGALPTLYAATLDLPGNATSARTGLRDARAPELVGRSKAATDERDGARAVGLSERAHRRRASLSQAASAVIRSP